MYLSIDALRLLHQTSEFFSNDEREQVVWLLSLFLSAESIMSQRRNLNETFEEMKEQVVDLFRISQDLDKAINSLNEYVKGKKSVRGAKFSNKVKKHISNLSLPLILRSDPTLTEEQLRKYIDAYARALFRANEYMQVREEVNSAQELPQEILKSDHWIEAHLRAKTAEERVAALMVHVYDLLINELPEFQKDIPYEAVINALCESLALYHRDTALFKLLYNPEGLNWYAERYGLTSSFLRSLHSKLNRESEEKAFQERLKNRESEIQELLTFETDEERLINLGKFLKICRESLNNEMIGRSFKKTGLPPHLSGSEFAFYLGMSNSGYLDIENGKRKKLEDKTVRHLTEGFERKGLKELKPYLLILLSEKKQQKSENSSII